ncbi:hypothetical protein V6N13_046738 [Hibiscus sabdariffa]
MSRDSPSLAATVFAPDVMQPFVAVNNSRLNVDPPDPGRHHDPMSLGLASDMDVSSSDSLTPTLDSPATVLHATLPDVCPVVTNATGADPTTSIPPVIATPSMTDEPFGPWMKVERRQRRVIRKDANAKQDDSGFVVAKSRFNPIFEDETIEEPAAHPTLIPDDSRSGSAALGLPLPTAVDPRGKGKVPVTSNPVKHHSPTSVRKLLVVQRPYATSSSKSGPSPSRRNSSLCNTRFTLFPRPPTRLNKSNHSAVVVSESDDPVILTDDSIPAMVRDSSDAPIVPNTLLGAVKPPNLEGGHLQSLSSSNVATVSRNAYSPSALPQDQQYLRDHRPTLLGLVEPRISGARVDLMISALGFPRSYRIEASGFSGSVYMLSLVYASPSMSRRKVGNSYTLRRPKLFPYFSGWCSHPDWQRMVQDNWTTSSSLSCTISSFTSAVDVWNKTVFGYIGTKKRSIMARLRAKQWKIRNHIDSLQLPNGSWCDDEQILGIQAAGFFRTLYSDPEVSSGSYSISGCFPPMPHHHMC